MDSIFFGTERVESIQALKILLEETNLLFCVGKNEEDDLLNQFCKKNGITCYKNSEFYELLEKNKIYFNGETLLVSYLFPNLIRKEILNYSEIIPINFHPAPLPEYKGCACSCFFLYENDGNHEYGVTAHYINEKFDEGDLIKVNSFKVEGEWSGKSFNNFVLNKLLELFIEIIYLYKHKKLERNKQDADSGRYYSRKKLNQIKVVNSSDDLETINRKIESFWFPPYHGATIEVNGQNFTLVNDKILREISKLYNR